MGRPVHRDGIPYKSLDFAIASFIFPERNVDDDHVLRKSRALGQMCSTMDGAQVATLWHLICDLMARDSVTEHGLHEKIFTNSAQFK